MTNMPPSELRRLRPDEIAMVVKVWRTHHGWSQEALAADAHVTCRTLQRAEAGKKVSDDILVRIAKALKMNEPDALTKFREVLSPEEHERRAQIEAQETTKNNWVVPASVATTGNDLLQWLLELGAWHHSLDSLASEVSNDAGALLDLIGDLVLFGVSDLPPSERIEMAVSMDGYVKNLAAKGFKIAIGRHTLQLSAQQGGQPFPMAVGYLRISSKPPATFLMPKNTNLSFA